MRRKDKRIVDIKIRRIKRAATKAKREKIKKKKEEPEEEIDLVESFDETQSEKSEEVKKSKRSIKTKNSKKEKIKKSTKDKKKSRSKKKEEEEEQIKIDDSASEEPEEEEVVEEEEESEEKPKKLKRSSKKGFLQQKRAKNITRSVATKSKRRSSTLSNIKTKKKSKSKIEEKEDSSIQSSESEPEESEESEDEKKKKKGKKLASSRRGKKEIVIPSINSLPEDKYLASKSSDLLTDCCIQCNLKNVFRAINTSNKALLTKCIEETKKISSLNSTLAMCKNKTPLEYCLEKGNKEIFSMLINYFRKGHQRVALPNNKLTSLSTGQKNFYAFGVKTRTLNASRGNKVGNNAFLDTETDKFAFNGGYSMTKFYRVNKSDIKNILFENDETFKKFKSFSKLIKMSNNYLQDLIYENIDQGNINIVEYLMNIFTSKEVYGFNKLHQLVVSQKKDVKLEIKNVQSTNKKSSIQITPVHMACINPNEKILEEVISKGGEIEFQDARGRKPISYAATCQGPGPLKVLLKKNCNVNDREKNGFTPLLHACRTGRYENVELLISKGANIIHKPRPGMAQAIHYACMDDKRLNIVKLLLKHNKSIIESCGNGKMTPLHFAVIHNCENIVEYLVKEGAKIDAKDKLKRTPLLLACKYGYTRIVNFLIKSGADIKKEDNSQNSPMHYACAFGNLECVKLLIDAGADVNTLNMWKSLPIEIASMKNHFGLVKFLLNSSMFDVNSIFGNGYSILLQSLSEIGPETLNEIKYLINDKKANAGIINDNKMNALHFLGFFSYHVYLSRFTTYEEKEKLDEKTHQTYLKTYKKLLKDLIELFVNNGCDCDLENGIGQTPLLFALENKNVHYALELLKKCKKKINVEATDNNNLGIFDYIGAHGNSLKDESIEFLNYVLDNYDISSEFLNARTRYGKNAILSLCEDFAINITERYYYLSEVVSVKYVTVEKQPKKIKKYSINPSKIDKIKKETFNKLVQFIQDSFYPLLEKIVSKGGDLNCSTEEKQFTNSQKFKMNYFNNYGKVTPLMYLMSFPVFEPLKDLITKYNSDVNAKDNLNKTPLMYLLQNSPIIKNISRKNYNKFFTFFISLPQIEIDSVDSEGNSAFLYCLLKNYQKEAIELYSKHRNKIDVNRSNNNNVNAFLYYIKKNDKPMLEFILNNFEDIKVNEIDKKNKRNGLHYACLNNSAKEEIDFTLFTLLIKAKANINQKDIFGRSPLFYLFIKEHNKIVEEDPISSFSYLIDRYKTQININETDCNGNTLLYYAVEANAVFCVSTLLSKGAKIKDTFNKDGNSIFAYALKKKSHSLPELFSKTNDVSVFNQPMNEFSSKYEEEILNQLKEKKSFSKFTLADFFKDRAPNQNSYYRQPEFGKNTNLTYEVDETKEKLFEEDNNNTGYFTNNFYSFWNEQETLAISEARPMLTDDDKEEGIADDNEDKNEDEEMEEEEENKALSAKEESEENEDISMDEDEDDKKNVIDPLLSIEGDVYLFNYVKPISRVINSLVSKNLGIPKYINKNENLLSELNKSENEDIAGLIDKEFEKNIKKPKKMVQISQSGYNILDKKANDTGRYYNRNFANRNFPSSEQLEEGKEKNNNSSDFGSSLFKYCIKNSQQDFIYYILNQGYDPFRACLESLECQKLKFCISLIERFSSISLETLKQTNEKGQNLIHILAQINSMDEGLVDILYKLLTTKIGIDKNVYDSRGFTPLYYACGCNNLHLIKLLTENESKQVFLQTEGKETPLNQLYKNINDSNINEIIEIAKEMKIGEFLTVARYLAKNYTTEYKNDFVPSRQKANLSSNFFMTKIIGLYQYLSTLPGFDIMIKDSEGNDVFSYSAIENNFDFFSDILIKEKGIVFDSVNKERKSLIHLIVSPVEIGSYQNEKFLKQAIKAGFKTTIKDKDEKTPLDYAVEFNYQKFIEILGEKNKKSSQKQKANEEDIKMSDNINYENDSDKYYKETILPLVNKKREEKKENILYTLVDDKCDLKRKNYLVCEDENNIPFDIDMAKVDINRFAFGEFLFYKLQLLHNLKRKIFILITRWGRFGTNGEYQQTPFTEKEEGIKEFKKIFLSKTGNDWDDVKNDFDKFEKKDKKFSIVKTTMEKPELFNIREYLLNETKNIDIKVNVDASKAPEIKQWLYHTIVCAFKSRFGRMGFSFNYGYNEDSGTQDYNIINFPKETLEKAFSILNQIKEAIDKVSELRTKKSKISITEKEVNDEKSEFNKTRDEMSLVYKKIMALSNSYYELVPFSSARNEFVQPIENENQLKNEIDRIQTYSYIESTIKLFLGSLYHIDRMNPIDYFYLGIRNKFSVMSLPSSNQSGKNPVTESDFIYNFIIASKNIGAFGMNYYIKNIFKIEESENDSKFNPENKGNKVLLFHGTKQENLIGILSRGLMIAPIEASNSGNRFGKGIYLTDTFSKAANYSSGNYQNGEKKYILICEAALGKCLQLGEKNKFVSEEEVKTKGYDSLINDCTSRLDMNELFYFKDGCGVFTKEQNIKDKNPAPSYVQNNYSESSEYVIYKEELVRVRYIVEFET